MARGRPVEPETRDSIVAAFAEGHTRNRIARDHGVSGALVSSIAVDVGHTFDRTKSELAVAARTIDLAKIRVDLAQAMAVEAWRALEDMHEPVTIATYQHAMEHTEGGWMEHTLDEPTIADRRNLMTIAGIAVSKIAELTRQSEGVPDSTALSYIDNLRASLDVVRDTLATQVPDSDPTVEPTNVTRESMLREFDGADEQ